MRSATPAGLGAAAGNAGGAFSGRWSEVPMVTDAQDNDGSLQAENARLRARVEELERRLGEGAQPGEPRTGLGEARIPFAAFFERIPRPILVYRADGLAVAVNEQACAFYNFPKEAVVGRFNVLHDPESLARGFVEPFLRALEGEVITLPATPYDSRAEGSGEVIARYWFEVVYVPFQDEAGARFVATVVRDVTANKEAEAQQRRTDALLKAIIDNAPFLIYARDAEGRFTVANRQTETSLGKGRGELLGLSLQQLVPRELADKLDAVDHVALASSAPLFAEDRVETPDGARVFMTTKFALRDDEGKVTGVCGISAEITERVRAEEQNRLLQEQMLRVQEETLRSISTPLLPIAPGVLVVPLVGQMTRERADQVIETLLHGVSDQQARIAIFDVTGVSEAGPEVTDALVRAARSVRLLGAEIVITGIRPSVAQALVHLDAELGGIVTRGTLERGVAYALSVRGRLGVAHPT
jgi:PAS domain S-box-containing protein